MRITNAMTSNKMLLNINRSARVVDNLYNQMTTGKKIQLASDDPIIAGRALRFRTSVAETEQYQRNSAQGMSWMEITEQGFTNVNKALSTIRGLCVLGASDQFELADRNTYATQIQMMFEQIGIEMGITYSGRYVFSGFRTDQPPVMTADAPDARYNITQTLNVKDLETATVYKTTTGNAPDMYTVNRLKLPYTSSIQNLDQIVAHNTDGTISGVYDITTKSVTDTDVYTPGDSDIFFVKETGELIFGKTALAGVRAGGQGGLSVNYNLTGLKAGDLNPLVYYSCTDTTDTSVTNVVDTFGRMQNFATYSKIQLSKANLDITAPISIMFNGVNQGIAVTPIKADAFIAGGGYNMNPNAAYYIEETGEIIFGSTIAANLNALNGEFSVSYNTTGKYYTMDNQEIQYEFSTNTRMTINNLAKDVYTSGLYADLKRLVELTQSIIPSTETELRSKYSSPPFSLTGADLETAISDQMKEENQKYRSILHDGFSNMLRAIDKHNTQIATEYTNLGSRMNRLDFISSRLEEDYISYFKLMSDNENVDYLEVITSLRSAEGIYQAAMKAGANIMQISLADFIR